MDYIKELQKIRTALLEAPNTNEKSPVYKILAYKKALEDFRNKEEKSFLSKILSDSIKQCNIENTEEPLKVESRLISRALGLNWHNLSDKEKLNLIRTEKRNNKSMDEIIKLYKDILVDKGEILHVTEHTQRISDNLEVKTIGSRRTYTTKL